MTVRESCSYLHKLCFLFLDQTEINGFISLLSGKEALQMADVFSCQSAQELSDFLNGQKTDEKIKCILITDCFSSSKINSPLLSAKILIVPEMQETLDWDSGSTGFFDYILTKELLNKIPNILGSLCDSLIGSDLIDNHWGLSRFFPPQAISQRFTVSSSTQRLWFRETLSQFVKGFAGPVGRSMETWANIASEVQEELLMNAIWDSNPNRVHADRKIPFTLEPSEYVNLEWSFWNNYLGICVQDPFGSFPADKIMNYQKYLFKMGRNDQIKVSTIGQGAGIGLFMVLQRMSALFITVKKNSRTEVLVFFKIDASQRLTARSIKSFGKSFL